MRKREWPQPGRVRPFSFASREGRLFHFSQTLLDGFQLRLQGFDLISERLLFRGRINGTLLRETTLRRCREKASSAASAAAKSESTAAESTAVRIAWRTGTGAISGTASCH